MHMVDMGSCEVKMKNVPFEARLFASSTNRGCLFINYDITNSQYAKITVPCWAFLPHVYCFKSQQASDQRLCDAV